MSVDSLNIIMSSVFGVGALMIWMYFYPENLNFLIDRISNNRNYNATIIDEKQKDAILTLLLPLAIKIGEKNHEYIERKRKKELQKLDKLLDSAGRPLKIKAIELYNMKFSGMIIFTSFFLIAGLMMDIGILLSPVGAIIGLFLPTAHVKSIAKLRKTQVELELPNILDLLSVCMKAGMPVLKSLEIVANNNDGILVDELKVVIEDTNKGLRLSESFGAFYNRCESKKIQQIYSSIKMSEKLGSPISKPLEELSESLREDVFENVKQKASKAALMVLFPVMFFILPSVMIITLGPAMMNVFNS